MGRKRIRKISMLLAVVLLGTMLFGNTASAAYWETVEVNAADLAVGDRVDAQYIVKPDGYVLTINGVQVSDKFAAAFPEGNTDYKYYEWWIDSYEKDDINKAITIKMNPVSDYVAIRVGGKQLAVKPGEKVTIAAKIPEEYKDSYIGFYEWRAWKNGATYIDLGLAEDELSKETITFVVPDLNPDYEWRSDFRGYMNVEYYYVLNSVSGNIIVGGDNKAFVDYVLPYDKENHSSDDQRVPTQGGNGTNEEASEPAKNIVQTANGDILTSTVDMLFGAPSVTGVAVTAPKETVNQAAGLSQEDIENGIRTKFYIGNVYKSQVKQELKEAAKELDRTIFTMLDLDLYRIGGKGGPKAVRNVSEPIEMIIEIPKSQIIEGRTFSLIGVIDGQYIELQDKDNDPNTITIDLNRFGAYALVYK